MAGNLLMSISQNERERAIYRNRMKFRTDMQSNLATSRDNGHAEGLAEGRAERNAEIARNLLKTNLPCEQIALVTGLTVEEVERLHTEDPGLVTEK